MTTATNSDLTITYNEVRNILNILPIGYYLRRRIRKLTLSEGGGSYYDRLHDHINIDFRDINNAFIHYNPEVYSYTLDKEEIIRGLLYHELSHVILTPELLMKTAGKKFHDIVNIFEDERIETVFKNFYMNVNFKKNVVLINGFTGQNADCAYNAYYNAVRFRHHDNPKILTLIRNMIMTYSSLNRNSKDVMDYINNIISLYEIIAQDYNEHKDENPEQQSQDSQDSSSDSSSSQEDDEQQEVQSGSSNPSEEDEENEEDNNGSSSSNSDEEENENEEDEEVSSSSSNKEDSSEDEEGNEASQTSKTDDSESEENDSINGQPNSDEQEELDNLNDILSEIEQEDIDTNSLEETINNAINEIFYSNFDKKLVERLKRIIELKTKLNKNTGTAINSYSGKFNVRSVARDDYKWWVQSNRQGHIRQFSKVHFNLFIDNSGSFYYNDDQMNKFIQSLNKIVSKDFDFDVITINTSIDEWKDNYREFRSNGGNRLRDDITSVIKRHLQNNANNYNIVLFDGDAHTDDYGIYAGKTDGTDAFRHFNLNNTIIISNYDNRKYIDPAVNRAKVIYTRNYCSEFINTLVDTLERAV